MGESTQGKKPFLLSFNPKARRFLSVDLCWSRKQVALMDLDGTVEVSSEYSVESKKPQDLVDATIAAIEILLTSKGLTNEQIESVGIVIPGVVDAKEGVVLHSSYLDWQEAVPLGELFRQKLSIPVYLENDANAIALGEAWIGEGRNYHSVVSLFMGEGIGGAFVLERRIFHGTDFAAAELGKSSLATAGKLSKNLLVYLRLLKIFVIDWH
ncbi:MAG: ROK family protein [Spirochaetales bacterium]|jgi:predicted NBD/HSP70 family sugar kinase|nr:ROK family protein [Spirochaetales bacterium]